MKHRIRIDFEEDMRPVMVCYDAPIYGCPIDDNGEKYYDVSYIDANGERIDLFPTTALEAYKLIKRL